MTDIGNLFLWWQAGIALLSIPLFILLYIFYKKRNEKKIQKLGEPKLINQLVPVPLRLLRLIQFVLFIAALFFVIIALMRPQGNEGETTSIQSGVEVVIAVDVSDSMDAQDVPPSRMENAKQICNYLIENLLGNRVGLVRFAADAKLVCPLTTDIDILKTYIDKIDFQPIGQGTDFGKALEKSQVLFSRNLAINKVIVIISDGEDLEGNALTVAQRLAEEGIYGFTLSIGTEQGSPIPLIDADGKPIPGQFKKDVNGEQVITKLSQDVMKPIAQEMGGENYWYSLGGNAQDQLLHNIQLIEKAEYESQPVKAPDDIYQWFLIFAIGLFLISLLIEELGKTIAQTRSFRQLVNR